MHAALFGAFMAQRYRLPATADGKVLDPVQWLLPPAPREPVPAPAAAPSKPAPARPEVKHFPVIKPPVGVPAAPVPQAAPPAPATVQEAPAPDPFSQPLQPRPSNEALLRGHDWGAGKADHELRGGKLAKLVQPTDTLQAGLEKAFRDAGEAVPPKWFQAPDIREISVPDGRTRVYKIRTAMGTYCFYKPDASLEARYTYALMQCPREK